MENIFQYCDENTIYKIVFDFGFIGGFIVGTLYVCIHALVDEGLDWLERRKKKNE